MKNPQTLIFSPKKQYILLLLIVLFAAFLRFFQLGTNPPSLTWDEVAWGYNAYSLGIDAKDEFGKLLPIQYLESFGDFKPPVYAYLDIIPIKLFGLNEFAVRFPSAFFGTLAVLMTYFLTKKILSKNNYALEIRHLKLDIPIIATAILAVSPWHIMLSRAAFEANIASFLIITGIYCFLEGIERKNYYLILSIISFVLSLYTFNSARVVAPLLVLILIIGTWKKLWQMKKIVIIAGVTGFLILLPSISFLVSPQASLRFKEVNIFTDSKIIETSNQQIANDHNAVWSKLLHNRRLLYASSFIQHYLDHFSPKFLFINGDGNPKFSIQTTGQLYLWELPFLILGLLLLCKKREGYWWIIPIWLLIAIIPAGVARETPHALRIENSLPTFQILVAYGLASTLLFLKQYKGNLLLLYTFYLLLIMLTTGNFIYFIHDYYLHNPRIYASEWQYGYKEAIAYTQEQYPSYNKIFLTGVLGRPYIYTLFYTKYDPEKFRTNVKIERDAFGFVHVKSLDKYIFGENKGDENQPTLKQSKTLYIDTPSDIPQNAKKLKTFYLLDGNPILVAYTLGD